MASTAGGSDETGGLPFIVSTSTKKPDPEQRKFIRSHVMIGKNRGRTLGSREKKDKKAKASGPSTDLGDITSSLGDISIDKSPSTADLHVIPKKVGSETSFLRFADTIDDRVLAGILEFSHNAKQAMFPLETCISFGPKEIAWIEALTLDAAYLHAMAFSTQIYFELLPGRPGRGASAYFHVIKTLQILRERLARSAQDVVKSWFSTTAVVMCLAFYAQVMGEPETAKHHMQGLRRIVDLKGGLPVLRDNVKLLLEIFRCDIGIALNNGSKPLFFANPLHEPYWPYPEFTGWDITPLYSINEEDETFLDALDPELATAWRTTRKFCALINRAHETESKLPKEHLLDAMASVTYRLLHKEPLPRGSLDEAVRLGLLAFASSVFLQWVCVRLPFTQFPATYRGSLADLEFLVPTSDDDSSNNSGSPLSPRLLLWLLTVGAVSVFGSVDCASWLNSWLRVNIELCGVHSWSDMRNVLHSFMWVGLVHDALGKAVFESAMSPNNSAP